MHSPPSEPSRLRKASPARLFWLLVAALCLAINLSLPWLQVGQGENVPRFATFLGRFHPLVLHLPIGLIFLAGLLELRRLPFLRRIFPRVSPAATTLLLALSASSATAAVVLGWLLSAGGGYDPLLVQRHFALGVATGACASLALLLQTLGPQRRLFRMGYPASLGLACGLIAGAGHFGAAITHGENYLTELAPNFLRKAMGLPPVRDPAGEPAKPVRERIVFADVIHPLFAQSCLACHGAEKKKGGLRMDTVAHLLKGGEAGPAIVPGDPQASEILRRIHLPPGDEHHMPPSGKPPLSDTEITTIAWWIQAGAPEDKRVEELDPPKEIVAALEEQISPAAKAQLAAQREAEAQKLEESLMAIRQNLPGKLSVVVPGGPALSYDAAGEYGSVGDAQIGLLAPIRENLQEIYLPRTRITDEGAARLLAQMENLRILHLQMTAAGDATAAALAALPNLETLNLYGTKVTDEGLRKLSAAPRLRTLYIAATSASPEVARSLRDARPHLKIIANPQPAEAASTSSTPKKEKGIPAKSGG